MTDYTPTQIKALDLFASALKRNDKATAAIAGLQAEVQESTDELQWIAAHPALRGIDLQKVAADIRESGLPTTAEIEPAPEAAKEEKPKRTRRTKAQIEADKAAEEAAKANVAGQEAAADEAPVDDDTFSEAEPEPTATVTQFPTPAPAAAPTFAPPTPGADNGGGFLNPFAQS